MRAEYKQEGGVAGPEDGDGKMLRKVMIPAGGNPPEQVPEFQTEGEQHEEVRSDGEESQFRGTAGLLRVG